MSYFRLSLLILCAYISISCFNKQDINANAKSHSYKTIEPYKFEDSKKDIVIEEMLPEITNEVSIDIYNDDLYAYDFFSLNSDEEFSKVGFLLPLSGSAEHIGKSMLRAAEMALFDSKNKNLELIIEDTKGTEVGAKMAAQLAVSKGAQILLGPVFSKTTEEVKRVADYNDINLISFSNNWKLADRETFLMGFMPYYQVVDILQYAEKAGYQKLAVILPDDAYGDLIEEVVISSDIINVVKMETMSSDANVQEFIKEFSGYNARKKILDDEIGFYQVYLDELEELKLEMNNADLKKQMNNEEFFDKYARYKELLSIEEAIIEQLDDLKMQTTEGGLEFDSILIPYGGDELREIASLLSYYDVPPEQVKYLGTGLFDDKTLNDEPALIKAWYAAPYSSKLAAFEKKYKDNFDSNPIRIASIAYDAISLLSSFAELDEYPDYRNLTSSSGFVGIDGLFKFGKNGLIERELSIMEIQKRKSSKKIK